MHTSEANFYTAVAIAAIVLGVIIIYFIISMIKHQRRNVDLYKQKIKAEIALLENERKRIATDLHDELGPLLSAVRIQINHLESDIDHDKKIVGFATKHIDDILTKTREISYNLLPNTLVRQGLVKALQELVGKLRDIHKLDITFRTSGNVKLNKESEVNIYRMLQEIIHNTIKHANASQLLIEMKRQDNKVLLMSADNGNGFDYEQQVKNNNGLGLISLQSRAEVLNSTFNFISEPGKGTQYFFEIPVN
jgi:signal transduction histidine kinase